LVAAVLAKPTSVWGRICTTRGLRFFGKYSYGLYVFHGLLVPWARTGTLMAWLERHLGSYALAWLAHFVILTSIATTAALLSWHLYEKHFLKLKRFFEYRATTLREPIRDAVVPPPVEGQANVRVEPVAG
jgi:peptidoglycan/LPS O-acetylase OafA/YrhL